MTKKRLEELDALWGAETNDEETWEWRKDLTEEETRIIELWDDGFTEKYLKLCRDILELDKTLEP
jgi:hypothetical protein